MWVYKISHESIDRTMINTADKSGMHKPSIFLKQNYLENPLHLGILVLFPLNNHKLFSW